MCNRKEDVSRKALLLLYLLIEAFDDPTEDPEYYYIDDLTEEDANSRLETRIEKMNLFLDTYGMNTLDPGSPFDLLILYAMKSQEDGFVSQRMAEVLEELFAHHET